MNRKPEISPHDAVLIVAPIGKDAALAAGVLQQADIPARICQRLSDCAAQISQHTLAILIAEEALAALELSPLLAALGAQPAWSDIPVIILTSSGGGDRMSLEVVDIFGPSGNVTLLERPLRSVTLISAVRVALRARYKQREVRRLLEQRETVLTGITDAFAALDRDWRYTYVNAKAAEYAGVSREGMIGKHIWEIYPQVHGDTFLEHARRALETQRPQQFERYYERWDCWLETRIYPAADGVSVFRANISERKAVEEALQRAKHDAEEANRAKDQFLAMLSHELRTPLTPVLMTIASLRRQTDISDDLRRDLEVLQRNVELEALLIDDLLDLTRITHGKLALRQDAVDVHVELEHALNISAADLAGKQLAVSRRLEAKQHHCWADAARLQQVFWNLVKNAVKFTAVGGEISVRTRNEGDRIIVEIADNGIGVAPELLPRIFDAFEQGGRTMTSQYGGLGLGLAISKRVIDLHGGTIAAESAGVGRGSTFTVTLAAMQTSLLEGPAVYLPPDVPQARSADILLVEDHEDTARVLRRILEQAGYKVAHAASVAAAQKLARERRFNLVISDVGLPDGTGLELMKSLRAEHALAGIALSGFGTDDDLAASADAGFAEHLTKPVDWPQLRSAIERLLASSPAETVATP